MKDFLGFKTLLIVKAFILALPSLSFSANLTIDEDFSAGASWVYGANFDLHGSYLSDEWTIVSESGNYVAESKPQGNLYIEDSTFHFSLKSQAAFIKFRAKFPSDFYKSDGKSNFHRYGTGDAGSWTDGGEYDISGHWLYIYSDKVRSPTIDISRDNQWHEYAFYLNFSTGVWRSWKDANGDYSTGNATDNFTDVTYAQAFTHILLPWYFKDDPGNYLFRIDDIEVWDDMPGTSATPPPPQDTPPTLSIQAPTSQATYFVAQPSINLEGIANDDNTIQSVTWSDSSGNSGTALNTSGDFDTWSISAISLQEGLNEITITATDSIGQKSVDKIAVTYEIPGTTEFTTAWTAETQAGFSIWADSSVVWCMRLLIKGDSLYRSGDGVRLGFQGRNSGDYTIKKVSLAERDPAGGEGDIIDSTWTEITFDGNLVSSWSSDVTTVYQGNVKLSDPISFPLQTGKDYYVTFLLTAPSTYLIAPAGYRELYFDGADHTVDLDWSSNGHSVYEERLHGLSIMQASGFLLPVPSIKKMDIQ